MAELVVVLVGAAIVVLTLRTSRRARARAHAGSRTVELHVDSVGVRRRLEDGRAEEATWSALTEVELVHTPVPTADGARDFVVLAENDRRGCLVPLGVGHDEQLMIELTRLPGFDLVGFERLLAAEKNGRVVCWRRQGPESAGGGVSTDGTGSS